MAKLTPGAQLAPEDFLEAHPIRVEGICRNEGRRVACHGYALWLSKRLRDAKITGPEGMEHAGITRCKFFA